MDYAMRGLCAVVTGADSGMGLATARMFLDEGVRVVISDRESRSIEEGARQISHRCEVHAVAADLTHLADVERLRDEALGRLGRVDILVNAPASRARRVNSTRSTTRRGCRRCRST